MKYTLISSILLFIGSLNVNGQQKQPIIRSIRTTIHQAVKENNKVRGGTIIENVSFQKFDRQGRLICDNIIGPDGTSLAKLVLSYDKEQRIAKQLIFSKQMYLNKKYNTTCVIPTYDSANKITQLITTNTNGDTLNVTTATYDQKGRIVEYIYTNLETNNFMVRETFYDKNGNPEMVMEGQRLRNERKLKMNKRTICDADTISLKLNKEPHKFGLLSNVKVKENHEKFRFTAHDTYGNWTQCMEYNLATGAIMYVIERNIDYWDVETERSRMKLNGNVKQVCQTAYKPIASGADKNYRGEKIGAILCIEFDTIGRKVVEDIIKDGETIGKIRYTYNGLNQPLTATYENLNGEVEKQAQYNYDKEGMLRRKIWLNTEKQPLAIDTYRYDLEGNLTSELGTGTDGKKYKEIKYKYNSYGQQVARQVIMCPEEAAIPQCIYSWNLQNRLIEEEVHPFNSITKLVYTYRYNKRGECIGGTEKINEEPEQKFVYKFSRDEQQNWRLRTKHIGEETVGYIEADYIYF